jgi:hypothetical protein
MALSGMGAAMVTRAMACGRGLAVLTVGLTLLSTAFAQPHAPADALEGDTEFGISFVGLANEASRAVAARHLPRLGVAITRLDADWGFREPEEGTFHWSPMDARMDLLQELGVRAVVTFPADAPDWLRAGLDASRVNERSVALDAAGRTAFAAYVRAFLERYIQRNPGVVGWVQFGNEWASQAQYAGSGADFVRSQNAFYAAVKAVEPDLTVVLGGLSVGWLAGLAALDGTVPWFGDAEGVARTGDDVRALLAEEEARFASGPVDETPLMRLATVLEGARYDWIDAHLYDQWEDFAAYVEALRSRLPATFAGRIVVTEFGGPHPVAERHLSDAEHARMLERYVRTIDRLDVAFALHFRLVRSPAALHDRSGLLRAGLFGPVRLPAYEVFRRLVAPGARD